jgi:hypothetical protein
MGSQVGTPETRKTSSRLANCVAVSPNVQECSDWITMLRGVVEGQFVIRACKNRFGQQVMRLLLRRVGDAWEHEGRETIRV